MSSVVNSKSYLVSSDIGNVLVKIDTVQDFDVEDIIRDRAGSQARALAFVNLGKTINPNAPLATRTIKSIYLNNTEELG